MQSYRDLVRVVVSRGKKDKVLGGMPLFGEAVSPYDEVIEKVTAETCTSENWTLILDICDKVVAEQSKGAKMCLLSLKKRLNHRDPHVVLLALSVLDSLWCNCGVHFRREVSSREFSQELGYKATHSNRSVGEKTRSMLKKWAENECKKDPSLGLIETLYKNLLSEGHSFDTDPPTKTAALSTDPNVVQSAEEEEAIARAIALSLDESNRVGTSSRKMHELFRSCKTCRALTAAVLRRCVVRDVRALYDFEAAEDNELTFSSGDVITVTDDSDPNWWRGKSSRGEGLFPASFVTSELNEPELRPNDEDKREPQPVGFYFSVATSFMMICMKLATAQKYFVSVDVPSTVKTSYQCFQTAVQVRVARIDESVLLECLRLLEDCDPTGERPDPPELAEAEVNSYAQVPLIDARLAEIDKQHNALAQVDIAIRDVLAMYDRAVQQVQYQVALLFPALLSSFIPL
uniref:Signal transducing adapter molecule 1 n=1 Tax=Ascaris lumbricoides TaxID=6252 RepID=A0A9J2PLE4_ASCLU